MSGCGVMVYFGGATTRSSRKRGLLFPATLSSAGGRLITIFSTLSSLLLLLVLVSETESVPTHDFREGQKEAASGWSLYRPRDSGHHGITEKRNAQPIQMCGYRLIEAVRGICRGNYVEFIKRSDPGMQDDERMMGDSPAGDTESSAQSSHHNQAQNGQSSGHFRLRRNIIDRCCMRPCSVNEMLRYCGRN